VTADDVTIDLGGFALTGAGSGSGVTDLATSRSNIAVHDGTVTGFDAGIGLQSTTDATVRNVRAFSNAFHGIVVGLGTVTGNTASDHRGDGIRTGSGSTVTGNRAFAIGVGIRAGERSTVTGNTAIQGDVGISVGNSSTVTGNTASGSGIGILVREGSTVAGNTASNNDRFGLVVNCPSNVFDNTVVGANEVNLELVSPAACNVVNNLAP